MWMYIRKIEIGGKAKAIKHLRISQKFDNRICLVRADSHKEY